MKFLLVAIILLFNSVQAHEIDFTLDEFGDAANNNSLFSSPLPLLYLDKGDYKISLKPTYFEGDLDKITTGNLFKIKGNYKGWGGSVGVSHSYKDKWGQSKYTVLHICSDRPFISRIIRTHDVRLET